MIKGLPALFAVALGVVGNQIAPVLDGMTTSSKATPVKIDDGPLGMAVNLSPKFPGSRSSVVTSSTEARWYRKEFIAVFITD